MTWHGRAERTCGSPRGSQGMGTGHSETLPGHRKAQGLGDQWHGDCPRHSMPAHTPRPGSTKGTPGTERKGQTPGCPGKGLLPGPGPGTLGRGHPTAS